MRKPKRMIFALAALVVAAGTALSAAGPAGAAEAVFTSQKSTMSFSSKCSFICPFGQIINYGSSECIAPVPGPDGSYDVNGLGIEQFTCDGSHPLQQLWSMVPVGSAGVFGVTKTIYQIVNWASHQCLDDRDGKTADRSPVQQWTCNDNSNTMQWALFDDLAGSQQLINLRAVRNGGSACLDVAGGSLQDGAVLQLYHCTFGNTAQHFYVP
jgi:hypothetical protein